MANPEVQIKALEKKMALYDKKFDQYDKQLRQIDYNALVKKLEKLEKAVGILALSLRDPQKFLRGQNLLDKETGGKLAKAIAERETEQLEKELKKELALVNKEVSASLKDAQKYAEKSVVEARLKSLEGLVATALSKR